MLHAGAAYSRNRLKEELLLLCPGFRASLVFYYCSGIPINQFGQTDIVAAERYKEMRLYGLESVDQCFYFWLSEWPLEVFDNGFKLYSDRPLIVVGWGFKSLRALSCCIRGRT